MLYGYAAVPNVHAAVLNTAPDPDDRLYAHPTSALSAAQSFVADGQTPTAVVIFALSPEEWGACCLRCYRRVGAAHEDFCDAASGPVLPTSAVLRPAREVRS